MVDEKSVEILGSELAEFGGVSIEWVLTPLGRKAAKASDVVRALGRDEAHASRLVNQYVFADYRFKSSFGESGRPAIYLYEHGVIQLATRIDSIEAEPFQRWVFDTVVKLFASSGYTLPTNASAPLKALMAADRKQKAEIAHLERRLEKSEALVKHLSSEDQTIADFFYDCTEAQDNDQDAFCFAAELYAVYRHWIRKTKRLHPLKVELWKQACARRFTAENFDGSYFLGTRIRSQYLKIGYNAPSVGEFK